MPLALQAKLLRVLERKVITRVGGTTEVADRCPPDRRDPPRPRRRRPRGPVPPGSPVPDRRLHARRAAAARSPERDRAARRALRARRPPPSKAATHRCSPRTRAMPSPATPGPATCASCATRSSARSCCAGDTITAADLPDRLRDAGQRTRPVADRLRRARPPRRGRARGDRRGPRGRRQQPDPRGTPPRAVAARADLQDGEVRSETAAFSGR